MTKSICLEQTRLKFARQRRWRLSASTRSASLTFARTVFLPTSPRRIL
jgi:hypothetical protein